MASVAHPLQLLLRKSVPYIWDDFCEHAFNQLKRMLTTAPLQRRPDFSRKFILATDWQPTGCAAILSQELPLVTRLNPDQMRSEMAECVIAYASKGLSETEQHYAPTEGELLALVWAVKHFRPYLFGNPFVLITDHKALTWLNTATNLSAELVRYSLILQEYDFEVRYRPGTSHGNADALSRMPCLVPEPFLSDDEDGFEGFGTCAHALLHAQPPPAGRGQRRRSAAGVCAHVHASARVLVGVSFARARARVRACVCVCVCVCLCVCVCVCVCLSPGPEPHQWGSAPVAALLLSQ
jgi:hypothetical protein